MSDITENTNALIQTRQPLCRVAYTINNTQPVISTIIGNQPLFYMDFETAYYEDENLMDYDISDIGVLESEIRALKDEINYRDGYSECDALSSEEKIETFFDDAHYITTQSEPEHKDINDLIKTIRQSRLAKAYLESAEKYDIKIQYSAQVETAQYDREAKRILVNPNINDTEQQLLTIQELRRHWQHRQGALIHPLMFHPDNAVLINRAQVADLAVSMIRVAWELQLAGNRAAWEYIENSSMADLGRAFAREAYLDFRTINNGMATAAVFESWFLSERCRTQDKTLINQMLSDYKGYVFDLSDAEKSITPTLIAALGEMPFGKNYLAEHALTIIEDPIFTEVRDRSNANFLWFIKFERSFRDSEQAMHHSDDSLSFSADKFQNHEFSTFDTPSAEIIEFYPQEGLQNSSNADNFEGSGKRLSPIPPSERIQNYDESNIIHLHHGSCE